jgi:hypothetical protein
LVTVLAAGLYSYAPREPSPAMPAAERAALAGLLLGPLLGVALGAYVTGAYYYRYTLPAVLGGAGLMAVAVRSATGGRAPLVLAALAFLGFGVANSSKPYREFFGYERGRVVQLHALLNEHAAGRTVVIASESDFGRAWYYADGRHYQPAYLADPAAARAIHRVDTTERALQLLKRVTPVPGFTADEIAARVRNGEAIFYLGPATAWPVYAMADRGVALSPIVQSADVPLARFILKSHVVPRVLP